MDVLEPRIHSFIIKIWLEDTAQRSSRQVWHAQITHVPGGERRSLRRLEEIPLFIIPYLEAMGVQSGLRWRLRAWLSRRRQRARQP